MKADEGILAGDFWSKILPVALKSGNTTKKIVAETNPKHRASAFSILEAVNDNK